jgi:outer membrane protein OmpA-like peptidoglycan-associated protein
MYQFQSNSKNAALVRGLLIVFALLLVVAAVPAQEPQYTTPTWRFGGAGAVNLNFYGGTTQMLNSGLSAPTAFHKGFGAGIFLAPVLEYRPNTMWGGILQLGYDDRRASFFDVPCPCGENSSLTATVSYISFEPSLRFSPFEDAFYIFGGPRVGYNFSFSSPDEKQFLFIHEGQSTTQGEFSSMNSLVFSGQIGVGYAIPLSASDAETQWELSPFVSFQPYFGQDPRSVETWAVSTVRVGASLTFGSGDEIARAEPPVAVVDADVPFTVRAPKAVPVKRRVRESFPMRDYVFFEEGSAAIPMRYEKLTKAEAVNFKEEELQEVQPKNNTGRSLRQMTVYYNILNVVGDRMKRNPGTTIHLSGSSGAGAEQGKERAESVKLYLVNIFGIDSARITTEGREKPKVQSEIIGGTKELTLIREGDNRVDIESSAPELMIQVGGGPHYMLKPVQIVAVVEDPLDSHVFFNAPGAKEAFSSWSIEVIDSAGKVQRFGPTTKERMTIPGNTILGGRAQGTYTVVMLAQTKNGKSVRKESTVKLIRRDVPKREAIRYSILFDFDKSQTVASYEKFLTEVVAPQIPDSGVVVIQGYTDIIGEEDYNENLSRERAEGVQKIIENALTKSKKRTVTFETLAFGEDSQYAPFDNYYPEQRFYNRSVIIDIVPE